MILEYIATHKLWTVIRPAKHNLAKDGPSRSAKDVGVHIIKTIFFYVIYYPGFKMSWMI